VTATIDEFQSQFPVTTASDTAEHLRVAIGEPRASGLGFVLDPSDVHELALLDDTSAGASDTATWTANIDNLAINQYACIEVFDESANGPGMVRCARASTASPLAQALALKGIWIDPETVAKVLENLSSDPWPTSLQNGLTLGMVINGATPASGYVVLSSNASGNLSQSPTVSYLSDSGFGGSATSSNGLFISRDAPFGTQFSIGGQGLPTMGVTGGAVNSKITVVILPVPAQ
jgi:hypothetical protein